VVLVDEKSACLFFDVFILERYTNYTIVRQPLRELPNNTKTDHGLRCCANASLDETTLSLVHDKLVKLGFTYYDDRKVIVEQERKVF
jgi:hypothetical protein